MLIGLVHFCHRAMPFAVVSAVSAAELAALGQMNEKLSTDQTGTLITGSDLVLQDDSWLTAWVKALFITRSGNSALTERQSSKNFWLGKLAIAYASMATHVANETTRIMLTYHFYDLHL